MDELGILYRYLPTELEPPTEMWDRLAKVLDDAKTNAFEKIDGLEIQPPISAWENIVSALDKIDTSAKKLSIADKFSAMEITPPALVWGKIETLLDADKPIKSIAGKPKTIKKVMVGLAIAACIASIIFSVVQMFDDPPLKQSNPQVATSSKTDDSKQSDTALKTNGNNQEKQVAIANKNNTGNLADSFSPVSDATVDEREFKLEKYKPSTVPNINTTNNMVASKTDKLKDAFGNVIDRISNYTTSGNYIAAIGPNGNSVNVSTKLANMIEFFREDSAVIKNEEYLDKVMRESNVWRQKLIDWRKKVDAADANPSQMNFLDPLDLIRFLGGGK